MPPLQRLWYAIIRQVVRWFYFGLTGGLRVHGRENVPRSGPLIIAPNHASYLDPPLVGCAMPRVVSFMAKEELFNHAGFAWLIRSLGAFPIRRGAGDLESIRVALEILKDERALLVFPEGTRNHGDQLHPFNRGVEMLARKSGALVLPVGLTGTDRKWGKGKKPRWGGLKVRFGKPINVKDFKNRDAFAHALESAILELVHADGSRLQAASKAETADESVVAGD